MRKCKDNEDYHEPNPDHDHADFRKTLKNEVSIKFNNFCFLIVVYMKPDVGDMWITLLFYDCEFPFEYESYEVLYLKKLLFYLKRIFDTYLCLHRYLCNLLYYW